jgi:hypothetical protein
MKLQQIRGCLALANAQVGRNAHVICALATVQMVLLSIQRHKSRLTVNTLLKSRMKARVSSTVLRGGRGELKITHTIKKYKNEMRKFPCLTRLYVSLPFVYKTKRKPTPNQLKLVLLFKFE